MIINRIVPLVVATIVLISAGCDINSFPDDPLPTVPPSVMEDVTLFARFSPYNLNGYSTVQAGATLTIEPGTVIMANRNECATGEIGSCAALIVAKGGRIVAEGTKEAPIIFTTESDRAGQWGGIVINGDAPCNTGVDTEAIGGTGVYCGSNEADDSGILKYVIIENAGVAAIDSSLHYPSSLALHGVGSGTQIEYVHAINSAYNGFTMVGGTVDLRRALASCVAENGFAWHDGWRGRGQFWISHQCDDGADSGIYGASVSPWSESLDLEPRSMPVVYNFSLMGAPDRGTGREGIELTLGTGGLLGNGIVFNHRQKGFWINDSESCVYVADGSISLRHIYFANNERDFTNRCGENDLFLTEEAGNSIGTSNFMQNPFSASAPNFMLTNEGIAYPSDPQIATMPWFEQVDFIGGMGSEDWTEGLRPER